MKTLEQEAEDWIKNTSIHLSVKNGYISGAKSKYVEREKIKFAIEHLKGIQINVFEAFSQIEVTKSMVKMLVNRIRNLEEQIKELEK